MTAPAPPDRALDHAVFEHLQRMPEQTRRLLEPLVASSAADTWLRDALMAYLRYFTRIFDREQERQAAEALLADELCALAGRLRTGDDEADITAAEAGLATGFAHRGYQFLGGRTPPHFGAYVWSRTEHRTFTATLPGGAPEEVDVYFLHDFLIRGWLHWQTFGEQGAGGWYQEGSAEWPDGLYCVAERYPSPETNPAFQVSLLGHEAQHIADHRAFPGLSSVELEYRAKLVELIGYETIDDRLLFFLADAADDPERPHPQAAHRILERLAERILRRPATEHDWEAVPYTEVKRHARALLDEDTARLTASV